MAAITGGTSSRPWMNNGSPAHHVIARTTNSKVSESSNNDYTRSSRLSQNSRVLLAHKMAAIERFSPRHCVLDPSSRYLAAMTVAVYCVAISQPPFFHRWSYISRHATILQDISFSFFIRNIEMLLLFRNTSRSIKSIVFGTTGYAFGHRVLIKMFTDGIRMFVCFSCTFCTLFLCSFSATLIFSLISQFISVTLSAFDMK